METVRAPFQGVWNVVRFNWHFYLLSIGAVLLFLVFAINTDGWARIGLFGATMLIVLLSVVSLLVTYWVYDGSALYRLTWLDGEVDQKPEKILNIMAGFDETSTLIHQKYPNATLTVLDFYDPKKHTEVSIKRARKAYPPYPGTLRTNVAQLELEDSSVDLVFGILAVHEIRGKAERVVFLNEVNRVLKPSGKLIITEHLRDTPNFMAYNIGAFHFHSHGTWLDAFATAGFEVQREIKITPFISTFIIVKNGAAS